jgi:hypothetical protein
MPHPPARTRARPCAPLEPARGLAGLRRRLRLRASDARVGQLAAPVLALLAAMSAVPAAAQGAPAVLTVYGGARGGGEFVDQARADATVRLDSGAAFSLNLDWPLADGRQGQVFASWQRSALPGAAGGGQELPLDLAYLHLGGRAFFDGPAASRGGYLVGGLGLTYLSPGLDGLKSEVRPSINLGIGFEWPLARQMALRAELRSYFTLVDSSGGFFCSGGCVVAIRGDLLTQAEAMLGVSVAF